MPDIHRNLERLSLSLPEPPSALASYVPCLAVHSGVQVVVSGQVPLVDGEPVAIGRVPSEVDIPTAQRCAAQCALNALAVLNQELGSLDRLRRVIRLGAFVACDPDFTAHPQVANGASDLLIELLGDEGRHARAAVGVTSLPLGVPVEIEFTFLVD